jgi:hypothetical protein
MAATTIIKCGETLFDVPIPRLEGAPPAEAATNPAVRQTPRIAYQRPVLAIPIRPDGGPDWENRFAGQTTDLGLEGLGLEFARIPDMQTLGLVLSMTPESGPGCLGVEVSNFHEKDGAWHVGAEFTGYASELLKSENLTPRLDFHHWRFELEFPEAILEHWAGIGVLEPVLWDRVQLCPRCQGVPTLRRGCSACGSIHVSNDRLIHHFACAHVGLVEEFEPGVPAAPGQLVCPKCRTRRLIVGSDYEYLTGPYRCGDCRWTGTELELIGQCLRCQLRFPVAQAYELELKGYRAHRLDPLALMPSLGAALSVPDRPALDRCAALCAQ